MQTVKRLGEELHDRIRSMLADFDKELDKENEEREQAK